MSLRDLSGLFKPRSIAILGIGDDASPLGAAVLRNINEGGFAGPLAALPWADGTNTLPFQPDLAVLCGPIDETAAAVQRLAARGVERRHWSCRARGNRKHRPWPHARLP